MPQRQSRTNTRKRVYIPSSQVNHSEDQWLWVDIETGPLTLGEVMKVERQDGESEQAYGIRMLLSRVKDWNLYEDEAQTVKVSCDVDNLTAELTAEDFAHLSQHMTTNANAALSDTEKKA